MKISTDPSLVFSIYFLLYLQSYVSDDRIPNSLFFFVLIFPEAAVKVYSLSLSLILIAGRGGEGVPRNLLFLGGIRVRVCKCHMY